MRKLAVALLALLGFAVPVYASPSLYIPFDFGADINGNVWNVWTASGSDSWGWNTDYKDGYLHLSGKIYDHAGLYQTCSGSCRSIFVWNYDPEASLGSPVYSQTHILPEGFSDGHVYSFDVQWDATGYTVTNTDLTIGEPLGQIRFFVGFDTSKMFSAFMPYATFQSAIFSDETSAEHASQFNPTAGDQNIMGVIGGGPDIRTKAMPVLQPSGPSILFIPGSEGSRLYEKPFGVELQHWPPSVLNANSDIKALYLDSSGKSIHHIYTKAEGTLSEVDYFPFVDVDVYKNFFDYLDQLKASTTISNWVPFPYDWRVSPKDIVDTGTQYDDGTHYIEDVVDNLAQGGSKVIIIGHSNGGLIAKALARKLTLEGKADKISKVILVGTPQLGTPEAVGQMLHGDSNPFNWIVLSNANTRGLTQNMPDAYDLLPSANYFNVTSNPVITVSATSTILSKPGFWSTSISTVDTLSHFLTEVSGHMQAPFDDTAMPSVLSSVLLSQASQLHADLDNWSPPQGMDLIQIAGWGPQTQTGEHYRDEVFSSCGFICMTQYRTIREPITTVDGDGSVVSLSAISSGNKNYFLNLREYNDDTKKNIKHLTLFELPDLKNLLSLLMASSSPSTLPTHVKVSKPISLGSLIRISVHSPVSLDAYDSSGKHVGLVPNVPGTDIAFADEQIPNSSYTQLGEDKYITIPATEPVNVMLHGLSTGTFTFQIDTFVGDQKVKSIIYEDIPVTASTTATIQISDQVQSPLALDIDGNGTPDFTIVSTSQAIDPLAYTDMIVSFVNVSDMDSKIKQQLLSKFANLKHLILEDGKWESADDDSRETKADGDILRKLSKIQNYIATQIAKAATNKQILNGKRDMPISSSQAEVLLDMITKLRTFIK